ncbi:MAG: hypothetical protein CMJ18_22055 [Phycisphaeraceae bacterium]|nr:hypothetical protein [Phycisphaeraceae bacterium]
MPKLIFNTDGNWMLHYLPDRDPSAVMKMLPDLVGSGVDCLSVLVGIDDDISWRGSPHAEMWGDAVEQWEVGNRTSSGGFAAERLKHLHDCMVAVIEDGRELMNIYIEGCRAAGVTPYASFRMNDAHTSGEKIEAHVRSRIKRDHPDWLIGPLIQAETLGWQCGYSWQWDYAHEAVRNRFLGLIDETLERYDFDGVEIDWMRQPPFFRPAEAYKHVDKLTDFMVRAREIVDRHARARGRALTLVARIAPDLDEAHTLGMDARAWMRRGLADIFVLGSASLTCPEMHLAEAIEHARSCSERDVRVYLGLEGAYRLSSPLEGFETSVPAAQRAVAHNAHADGVDGVYIFNYDQRGHRAGVVESQDMIEEHKQLLRDVTRPDALAASTRCYTVTSSMIGPNRSYAHGDPRPKLPRQLPILAFGSGPRHAVPVRVADDVEAGLAAGRIKKIELRLRLTDHEDCMDRIVCEVNGERVDLNDRPTVSNRWDDTWIQVDDAPVVQGGNNVLVALDGHQVPDPWPVLNQCEIVLFGA